MGLNSINTNISAYYAQMNIGKASTKASSSIARLSSGSRIVRAADDVAAMSAGTSLRTNVTTLRMALINTSQGSSMLQVADGALGQITDILQRQKSIAVQAGSGSLSSQERSFLNQEFQNLSQEIDRLAKQTNFNGVTLLDGSLFDINKVETADAAATQADLKVTFTNNIADNGAAGAILRINGVNVTFDSTAGTGMVTIGSTLSDTMNNLVDFLNAAGTNTTLTATQRLALSKASYSTNGSELLVKMRAGGAAGQDFFIDNSVQTSTALSLTGDDNGGRIGNVSGSTSSPSYVQLLGINIASTNVDVATGTATTFANAAGTFVITKDGTATTIDYGAAATLEDMIDAVNAETDVTGVTASIIGGAGGYGISFRAEDGGAFTVTAAGAGAEILNTQNVRGSMTSDISFLNAGATDLLDDLNGIGLLTANALSVNGIATANVGAGTTVLAGNNSIAEFVDLINAGAAVHGVRAAVIDINRETANVGGTSTLVVRLFSDSADKIEVGGAGAVVGANLTIGTSTQRVTSAGGVNDGVGIGNTDVSGVVGDSVISALDATRANISLNFSAITTANLSTLLREQSIFISNGNAADVEGFVEFKFVDANDDSDADGTYADNQVEIGATLEETLDNLVSRINTYAGPGDHVMQQFTAKREGRNVVLEGNAYGDIFLRDGTTNARVESTLVVTTMQISGDAVATAALRGRSSEPTTTIDTAVQGAFFTNGTNTGIDTTGITSKQFTGKISGFTAAFNGVSNQVDLSLTLGTGADAVTYTASRVTTNPTSATTVRFLSQTGGYFDVTMAANQGSLVANQSNADDFARRFDAAFSGLTFYQNREVDSFVAAGDIITNGANTGSLTGTSMHVQLENFSEVNISRVDVTPPPGGTGDAIIEFTVNGEIYRNESGIGNGIAANTSVRFRNLNNANEYLQFNTGNTAISFATSEEAANFQSALETALGIGSSGQSLNFQVGVTTEDTLSVRINSVTTEKLFDGQTLDVLTAETAAAAADAIDAAIDVVTAVRAEVGALQSRFDFAAANVESSIQNQDAARGVLLDTDIAAESSAFATAQVQLQAGISVLAQANLLPQNLLKLIG